MSLFAAADKLWNGVCQESFAIENEAEFISILKQDARD
jgi:hypothetical protein